MAECIKGGTFRGVDTRVLVRRTRTFTIEQPNNNANNTFFNLSLAALDNFRDYELQNIVPSRQQVVPIGSTNPNIIRIEGGIRAVAYDRNTGSLQLEVGGMARSGSPSVTMTTHVLVTVITLE